MKKLHNLAINLGLILGTLIFTLTFSNISAEISNFEKGKGGGLCIGGYQRAIKGT